MKNFKKLLNLIFSFLFLLATLPLPLARAEIITTKAALHAGMDTPKERIAALISRDDVRAEFARQGISVTEASVRINALSDSELALLAESMENSVAGGDGFSTVITAAVVVFLVLLFTDIIGVTKLFSFTRPLK